MVDSRFDAGYFVTVRIGKHEFKGMLYYPPPEHTQVALPSPAWHLHCKTLRSRWRSLKLERS